MIGMKKFANVLLDIFARVKKKTKQGVDLEDTQKLLDPLHVLTVHQASTRLRVVLQCVKNVDQTSTNQLPKLRTVQKFNLDITVPEQRQK
jgi:hypothetical protein